MLPARNYPAKLLLFGEYSVIFGAEALAVPFPKFESSWALNGPIGPSMEAFLEFLKGDSQYDTTLLNEAFAIGWTYSSNIPIGYGLGSSAALVAAIYDACRIKKEQNISAIKHSLGTLESFFHGSSSGTDPLISYINKGLYLKGKNDFEILSEYPELPETLEFFLLDTTLPRSTAPLVQQFLKSCTDPRFKDRIITALNPQVSQAVEAYKNEDGDSLFEGWKAISLFQWEYFQNMIPNTYKRLWKKGLEEKSYYLKLCGAGGGGFLLGVSAPAFGKSQATASALPGFQSLNLYPRPPLT